MVTVNGEGVVLRSWRGRGAVFPARKSGRDFDVAATEGEPAGRAGEGSSVLIGHQRDPDVVHDERREGQGVEDLVEAEPLR
ncbi:hypothetical protein SAVCW2_47950 [Streptomyces avermitilis]|uniref:Uncharacterized protein n=1 Tax=Streptomyces avermitilis TaxID=33903 RepID=A0A4D4MYB8_STRAX|nr:hypothetical protein SAVMC3_37920 [Streptomyces avermitilis]GDY76666.1 hypothetical protein SAV31267_061510 [Streptomyces avermitilis]GDY85596.1 hypothetical protein SAVCW2_47950 [Streptomyces avermitilis]